jgi:hypothetical protein
VLDRVRERGGHVVEREGATGEAGDGRPLRGDHPQRLGEQPGAGADHRDAVEQDAGDRHDQVVRRDPHHDQPPAVAQRGQRTGQARRRAGRFERHVRPGARGSLADLVGGVRRGRVHRVRGAQLDRERPPGRHRVGHQHRVPARGR